MAPPQQLVQEHQFLGVCGHRFVPFFHLLEPLRHKILGDDVLDSVGVLFLVGPPTALADSHFGRRFGRPAPRSASWTSQSSSDLPQSRQNAPRLHKYRRESRSAPTAARLWPKDNRRVGTAIFRSSQGPPWQMVRGYGQGSIGRFRWRGNLIAPSVRVRADEPAVNRAIRVQVGGFL